jgi:transcriptional regulator with XRE-family HTH domain
MDPHAWAKIRTRESLEALERLAHAINATNAGISGAMLVEIAWLKRRLEWCDSCLYVRCTKHRLSDMTLGMTIRYLRQSKRLPQAALAAALGISPSYLSQLEGDKREPTIPLLRRLAEALGAPAALLFAAALAGTASVPERDQVQAVLDQLTEAVGATLQQEELPLEPATDRDA